MKQFSFISVVFLFLNGGFCAGVSASSLEEESSASSPSPSLSREAQLVNQALTCEKAEDFKGAVHFWSEYFEAAPDPNPLHYVSYAKDLGRIGETTLAARIWTKHMKKTAEPKLSHCAKAAYACMKIDDFETAVKHWDRVKEVHDRTGRCIDVSWLPGVAITHTHLGNYDIADGFWKVYFSYLEDKQKLPYATYIESAMYTYVRAGKNHDVKGVFERYEKRMNLTPMCYHHAGVAYYWLREHKKACPVWDTYFAAPVDIAAQSCRLAAVSFIAEGRLDRAVDFYKKIPLSDKTASDHRSQKQLSHLASTKSVKRKHGQKSSRAPTARKRGGPNSEILHMMQVAVVSNVVDQARSIIEKVSEAEDEALTTLRARMLALYGACQVLEAAVKSTPYATAPASVPTLHVSSSSGASSSSSSEPSSSSAPQAPNPVQRVQDLLRQIETLHKEWSRKYDLAHKTRLKEERKAHFLAFAENPGSIFTLPPSMNVRYLYGHEKKKPAAPAPLVPSSSCESSSSSACSSSAVSVAPTVTWGFATRHVTKQRERLKHLPAYMKDKIDVYVSEIEADPLQQRLKSGRLKRLVGAPNTYSRRVDDANRFSYQIQETAPGHFNVTILSFLGHYKNLDFSKLP